MATTTGRPAFARQYTQPKFVTHEAIASGLLNQGHCSAVGILLPWKSALTNDDNLLNSLVGRMQQDWESLQRVCGMFQACLQQFLTSVPKTFSDSVLAEINKASSGLINFFDQQFDNTLELFELRHGDADLTNLMEQSVPPADLGKAEKESKDKASEPFGNISGLAALDFKHLNDRYVRGKAAVDAYMATNHQLIHVSSLVMAHGQIVSALQSLPHNTLTILLVDVTVWPSRAVAIDKCIQLCQGISTGNSKCLTFFLLPQAWNASHRAQVNRNKRLLEDKIQGRLGARVGAMVNSATSAFNRSRALLGSITQVQRFAEWSHAAWDMQRERLEEPSSKLDVRFISVYHDDSNDMASHTELIRGKIMRDWWDGSDQAGAKSRSSATFGESLPALDCLAVINGDVKKLE
ncbi:unnamed protein product, partial [Durusdinium trenchii]